MTFAFLDEERPPQPLPRRPRRFARRCKFLASLLIYAVLRQRNEREMNVNKLMIVSHQVAYHAPCVLSGHACQVTYHAPCV